MKKLIIFVILFVIIAVGSTMIMIKITNSNNNANGTIYEETKKTDNKTTAETFEKTINLNGTYSQNDLIILENDYYIEEYDKTIKIPQISGLKNKNIENKINDNIKTKVSSKVKNILLKENGNISVSFYANSQANFSNIISCGMQITLSDHTIKYICLNYNLVNGEELTFEDLFKKDENLKPVLRMALYRSLLQEQNQETSREGEYSLSSPYYDTSDKTWYAEKIWFDENGEHKETIEYTVPISEYEIEKYSEKFLNAKEKEFYFTRAKLNIIIDDIKYCLYFKDIADKVVIYDKYLTKESLFEENNIGAKSFIACSEETNLGQYKKTKYESDNFFFDTNIVTVGNHPDGKFLDTKIEEQIQGINKIINEYKKTAENNTNKAYFLFVESQLSSVYSNSSVFNEENGKYENFPKLYNLFITNLKTKVIICDINEKESVIEKILSAYRYYNFGFYGSIINCIKEGYLIGGEYLNIPVNETNEQKYYDVLTGSEIMSVKDIFKDEFDYIRVIRSVTNNYEIDENTEFELFSDYIKPVRSKKDEQYDNIYYSEIEEYLKLKEIKSEILPSSKRQINKVEIENMNEDELYMAYNEIFARHGHDFKTPEYKNYFSLWDWYEPINGKTVTVEELSDIEKYNFNLIKSVIDEKY